MFNLQGRKTSAMPIGARESATIAILAAFSLSLLMTNAQALECPQAQESTQRGALKESARVINMRAQMLAARGSAAIPGIIFGLRKKYPNSTDGEITNYLITAYCPVINQKTALSDKQKRAKIMQFSSQVQARLAQ